MLFTFTISKSKKWLWIFTSFCFGHVFSDTAAALTADWQQQHCLRSRWQFTPSWSPLGRARRSLRSTKARKSELLNRSSSWLELTAASSPSLPVRQSQSVSSRDQDSSFQTGLSLTYRVRTIEEIELNWTVATWQDYSFIPQCNTESITNLVNFVSN